METFDNNSEGKTSINARLEIASGKRLITR